MQYEGFNNSIMNEFKLLNSLCILSLIVNSQEQKTKFCNITLYKVG